MKTTTFILIAAGLYHSLSFVSQADPGLTMASPEGAQSWLLQAIAAKDKDALVQLFGSDSLNLVNSGDATYDDFILGKLFDAAQKQCVIDRWDESTVFFNIGPNSWQLPIPLVKTDKGWVFNPNYDKAEILQKRTQRNQVNAVEICRAYVQAQEVYAEQDRNGNQVRDYAQKFISTPGQHDGLYWPVVTPADVASPLGPIIEKARSRGYAPPPPGDETVYQGYTYRILTSQGDKAPGGSRSYLSGGKLIGGFGLICWPAKWGDSGKLTYMVNQSGQVLQRDLGAQTSDLVKGIKTYNPDSEWSAVNF